MFALPASHAAVINTFTDRATFNGAVGPTTVEDFNSFGSEVPFHTTPLDVGPFTFFMTGNPLTTPPRNSIDPQPLESAEFNVDGTTVAYVYTTTSSQLFLSFDDPIFAFGADFAGFNDNTLRTQIFVDGELVIPPVTAGTQVRFFGFQTDTAFSTVEFRGIVGDPHGMDNVAFSQFIAGIISFHNGELAWLNEAPDSTTHTVEWAPALTGSWNSSWSSLTDINPTGGTVTVEVPMLDNVMFYRVVRNPKLVIPEMVTVANPGNPADTNVTTDVGNSGAVSYTYKIGKYEVTNTEYTEFLNAVDPSGADALDLYSPNMGSDASNGGITFNGGNPDGLKYAVKAGFAIKPVVYVSFYDAMRFCNWLHNGARPGKDTENGAYTLLGGTAVPINGTMVLRNAGAKFVVPTEDEWYKAAYYEPGGDADDYWLYPTRGNSAPNASAPPGTAAAANYNNAVGNVTDAGAYNTTENFHGTFDMAANVAEWGENIFSGSFRLIPGGAWGSPEAVLASDLPSVTAASPDTEGNKIGFRTARVFSPPPAGMVLIPAGDFVMGDTFGEGGSIELPLHTVTVSAFYMDATEVTKTQWDAVYGWAVTNGYGFDNAGLGKAASHPVHTVNWYDCVKWANARSEMVGLTPVYYTDATQTTVYRAGALAPAVDWYATGYRLPTEAEWEKAARGGTPGTRFPWTGVNTIQHTRANYFSFTGGIAYDTSAHYGFHPNYDDNPTPYTSPVGSFAPNGYGLYDMAGNVEEFCWDWHGISYYAASPGTDPHGPVSGPFRVHRGGFWVSSAGVCRVAYRNNNGAPGLGYNYLGFRLVRAAR
jgi:formylglycine-generating enzyme required for sulfatase activity